MKVILAIFCSIFALFSGGCALILGGNVGALALIPAGVFILNGFVLAAIFGFAKVSPVAFYTLVVLDFVVAIGLAIALGVASVNDPLIFPWGYFLIGAFVLKGVLTWIYVRAPQAQ